MILFHPWNLITSYKSIIILIILLLFTVSERKVNMTDVSVDEVEKLLLGDRLKDVKRLVEKANILINQTKVYDNTIFVSCAKATSRDKCGNKYLQEVMESNQILTNNYVYSPGGIWKPKDCLPRWKVSYAKFFFFTTGHAKGKSVKSGGGKTMFPNVRSLMRSPYSRFVVRSHTSTRNHTHISYFAYPVWH